MPKLIVLLIFSLLLKMSFSQTVVSQNGKYILSTFKNDNQIVSVCQATNSSWKKEFYGVNENQIFFINNAKQIYYQKNDSIIILSLESGEEKIIPGIKKIILEKYKSIKWISYLENDTAVVFYNVENGVKREFIKSKDHFYYGDGDKVMIVTEEKKDSAIYQKLNLIELNNASSSTVWYQEINNTYSSWLGTYALDNPQYKLAFIIQDKHNDLLSNSIWYYDTLCNKAVKIANNTSQGIDSNLVISNSPLNFSEHSQRLYFSLQQEALPKVDPKIMNVDVYSYLDAMPMSQQRVQAKIFRKYCAVLTPSEKNKVIRLEFDENTVAYEKCSGLGIGQLSDDNNTLVAKFEGNIFYFNQEGFPSYSYSMKNYYNWNKLKSADIYLVSSIDASRKLIYKHFRNRSSSLPEFWLSPGGKFILFYNYEDEDYYSFEIISGITRKITEEIKTNWLNSTPVASGGAIDFYFTLLSHDWVEGDQYVLLTDHFGDIWKVSLLGKNNPLCLTKRFSFENKKLKLFKISVGSQPRRNIGFYSSYIYKESDKLFFVPLSGKLDYTPRGLYQTSIKGDDDLHLIPDLAPISNISISIIKSLDNEKYVFIGNNKLANNIVYYTSNLFSINKITVTKETKPFYYNREMFKYKDQKGDELGFFIYKPLDFSPFRKYPVLFTYYENMTKVAKDRMPIRNGNSQVHLLDLWLKNGYIVCAVDLYCEIGNIREDITKCILSATKQVSGLSYVDSTRMGIYGHSFGGYETNLLLTTTSLFKAAFSSAGISDLFSLYGTEPVGGRDQGYGSTDGTGQIKLGVNPWERPDIYIKNSPIFFADRVSTPVLFCANYNDGTVPFAQGFMLFNALRRLGKPAWLLQNAKPITENTIWLGHSWAPENEIRVLQFFDYYLKNKQAPTWMTRGIPASKKGTTSGIGYDSVIKVPGAGLAEEIQYKTPEQKELLKHRTRINEKGRIEDVKQN